MVVIDDYSIEFFPLRNQIVIQLPQTVDVTNTTAAVMNIKTRFSVSELAAILMSVKAMAEAEHDD